MKHIAIVGSRNYPRLDLVRDYVLELPQDVCIVSGGAQGVDKAAEVAAQNRNIQTLIFYPDWNKYGKSAGMRRNADIVQNCHELVAFWDGNSRGTSNSIQKAKARGIPYTVFYVDGSIIMTNRLTLDGRGETCYAT